jgi:methionyl-tRNA formyltransferase
MKAIILTSTFLRHQYMINTLAQRFDVVGVWQEEKSFVPERYAETEADHLVIQKHFAARDASEEQYFGDHAAVQLSAGAVHRRIAPGTINNPAAVEAMAAAQPDVLLVFGTGILKAGIITHFDGRIINIHLGLSPYYRGAGTNFWPLVNREPEYVGATIHYLDAGIDTGAIIAHVRPRIVLGDDNHDIGNKTIIGAVQTLGDAAEAHMRGVIGSTPQTSKGRLYQRKDFNADAVRQLYRHFETGMIEEYLADQARRDAALELVTLKDAS